MKLKLAAVVVAIVSVGAFLALPGQAAPVGTIQVQALLETPPSGATGDNIDDPALWVNPADPSKSLVIGNEKKARQLSVYNLAGQRVQTITNDGKYFGNVDVRGDYIVASNAGVTAYRVVNGQLVNAMESVVTTSSAGEGLCLWNSSTGLYVITVVKTSNRVRMFPLTDADNDGLLQLQPAVKDWTNASEGESCEVDDSTGTLYLSEEDVGIWTVNLALAGKVPTRKLLVPIANNLSPDIEGLAIVGDLLIASSQNVANPQANWYSMFNKTTGAYVNSFRVADGPTTDDCDETDGLLAYRGYLGPTFPHGIFICQDGYNAAPGQSGAQDFKFVPLERLPGLAVTPPTTPTSSTTSTTTPTETTPTETTPTETTPTETTSTETTPTETTPTETTPTETTPTPTDPPTTGTADPNPTTDPPTTDPPTCG